jgi:acetyl-CoA synthetase
MAAKRFFLCIDIAFLAADTIRGGTGSCHPGPLASLRHAMESSETNTQAWAPDEAVVARSQLSALMSLTGFSEFEDLHRWSVSDPDAFWKAVIEALEITFERDPTAIRGSVDPRDPQWLPGAVFNIVASCLDHGDDEVAIRHGREGSVAVLTVSELRTAVAAFAAGFTAAGFSPGDAIAIVMPMTVEAVIAYLGTVAAGGVVVAIADSFAPDEIRTRLDITHPVAVVTQDVSERLGKTLPMYAKCLDAGAPRAIVVETSAGLVLRDGDIGWDSFIVRGAPFAPHLDGAGAYTNILFSSGTTGEPKAIPWSQTTPLKAGMDGRYHHDIHAGDVVAWPTNLGWMMGPWLIYASLLNGASLALYDDAPTTGGFVSFVEEAGVTMLGVVPSIVAAWRSSGVLSLGDWTSVRVISSTGEASNADDYRWLMSTAGDVPVIEYCGGTEIGGGYMSGTVLQPAVPGRFTTPTLGLDLVILDDEGIPADVGEVFIVPPSIGLSTELINQNHESVYFSNLPEIGRPLRRHGDHVRRFPDRYLQALGRVDDTMNLGGIKVSSADIESVLSDVDSVVEVAAVASTPQGGGPERLIVFAVVGSHADDDRDSLRIVMQAAIRSELNPLFKIHEVVVVESLPRTASHKLMRRTLRDDYFG